MWPSSRGTSGARSSTKRSSGNRSAERVQPCLSGSCEFPFETVLLAAQPQGMLGVASIDRVLHHKPDRCQLLPQGRDMCRLRGLGLANRRLRWPALRLGPAGGRSLELAFHLPNHAALRGSQVFEHQRGDPLSFDRQAHQNVAALDSLPTHSPAFLESNLDNALDPRRRDWLREPGTFGAAKSLLDHGAHRFGVDCKFHKSAVGRTRSDTKEPQENVFRADIAPLRNLRLFLGGHQRLLGIVAEAFERVLVDGVQLNARIPKSDLRA